MKPINLLYAFLGGALVGAAAALLLAPEKGEDLRGQIKDLLKKYGICKNCKEQELDEMIDELETEIKKA